MEYLTSTLGISPGDIAQSVNRLSNKVCKPIQRIAVAIAPHVALHIAPHVALHIAPHDTSLGIALAATRSHRHGFALILIVPSVAVFSV
jgi:hypothetical protein